MTYVFILHGQVSHVEMLNILKYGINCTTMWLVITCITFWLITLEPWDLSKWYLHHVILGWSQIDCYRPHSFVPGIVFRQHIFWFCCHIFHLIFTKPGTYRIYITLNKTYQFVFVIVIFCFSAIGHQTFEGVVCCTKWIITLQLFTFNCN